jgi:hypothetical protein
MRKNWKIIIVALVLVIAMVVALSIFYIRMRPPAVFETISNSWIMDPATIEYEQPREGYGAKQWWAWYGYAYTADGKNELLLNGNLYPSDPNLNGSSYTLNGQETSLYLSTAEWDATTNTLSGEMKRSDGVTGTWSLEFPDNGYRVYEQTIQGETLKLEMRSKGTPLWGAETENEMTLYDYYDRSQNTPIYAGGFHDAINITATLTTPSETYVFNGEGMYARVWLKPMQPKMVNAVLLFVNQQADFYLNFIIDRNPYDTNQVFVKSGRIGFPLRGEAYSFDNFTYYALSGLYPQTYYLKGTYEKGTVDLTGERIGWVYYKQRHPLIQWKGTITIDGQTINVDSLGGGEIQAAIEAPQ